MKASGPARAPFDYRRDPAVPPFPDDRPIVVFDGHCVMCSGFARSILSHDKAGRYRLLPAQTPLGRALYVHYGLDPESYETNILIEDGRAYLKAQSAIKMAEGLSFPLSLARLLRLLPSRLADRLYDLVARNRFRLFGRAEVCFLTQPGMEERFLA